MTQGGALLFFPLQASGIRTAFRPQVTQIAGTNASVAEFVPIVRAAAEVVTVAEPPQEPLSAGLGAVVLRLRPPLPRRA